MKSQKQVAELLGISQQRVHILERRALQKMRAEYVKILVEAREYDELELLQKEKRNASCGEYS